MCTAIVEACREIRAGRLGVAELVPEKGLLPADTLAGLLRPEVLAGSRTLA
ncbi:hypothetical protein GCM10010294_06110 [Streptomyces griseoloalbus]|uniref:hypothetical protein n=1 Tax=Streptomyces griseoloalbus TaxID=67303 RepID=UPI001874B88D|nr:hypothetical protein GCM10010294_06110 [Streptomyces griseoloalbus]